MFEWFLESQGDSEISCQYILNEFREYTIGRHRGYDISSQNTFVSRNHGVLIVKPDNSIYIKDLNSANGVYINDRRITSSVDHILELNDLIGIGTPSTHLKSENLIFTLRRRRLTGLTSVEIREPDSSHDALLPCSPKSTESSLKSFEHLVAEVEENFRSDFRSKEQNNTKKIISNNNSTITQFENAERKCTNHQTKKDFRNFYEPAQKVFKNENIAPESDSRSFSEVKNRDIQNTKQLDNNSRIDLNNSTNIENRSQLENRIKVSNDNLIKKETCQDDIDLDSNVCTSANSRNEPLQNSSQINNNKNNCEPEPIKITLYDDDIFSDISAPSLNDSEKFKHIENTSKSELVKKVFNDKEIDSNSSTCSSVIVNNTKISNEAQIISCNKFLNDSKTTVASNIKAQKTIKTNDCILNKNKTYISNSIKNTNDIFTVSTSEQINNVLDKNNKLTNSIDTNVSSSKTTTQNEVTTKVVVNIKKEIILNEPNKQSTSDYCIYISDSDENMDEIPKEPVVVKQEPTEHQYSFTQNEDNYIEILESEDDEDIFPRSQLFDDVVVKSEPKDDDDDDFIIESIFNTECGINVFRDVKAEEDPSAKPIDEDEYFDDFEDDSNIWKQKLKQQQDIISCSQDCVKIKRSDISLAKVDEKSWFPVFDDQDLELDRTKVVEIQDKLRLQDEEQGKIEISATVDAREELKSDRAEELELISKYKANILEVDKVAEEKSSDTEQGTSKIKICSKSEEDILTKKHFKVAELETSDEDDLIIRRKRAKHSDSRKKSHHEDVKKKPSTKEDIQDSSVKTKETSKKLYVKPPVIDAPFMCKGKRKAHEDPKPPKESTTEKKRRKSIVEEKPVVIVPSTSNTSVVADKSIREEFNKRKKKRRRSSELIDRNQKQHIQEERKKKLKELTEKKELEAKKIDEKKNSLPPKHGTKPKVKISESRGSFLADHDSRRESESKRRIEKSPEIDNKVADTDSRRESEPTKRIEKLSEKDKKAIKSYGRPKVSSKVKDLQKPSTSKITSSTTTKSKENKSTNDSKIHKLKGDVETGHETKQNKKNNVSSNSAKNTEVKTINYNGPKSILKHHLKTKNDRPKKVCFAAEPQVKIFHSFNSHSEVAKVAEKVVETREDEILIRVFSWMPMWLEEQKNIIVSPKLWIHNPLQMYMHFNSVGDYHDIVTPLMLLEFWRAIYKDWCDSRVNFRLVSLDELRNNGPTTCLIHCHCLIYKNDLAYNPCRGDLIVMDIMLENKSSTKKFGYITDVSRRRNTEETTINKKLGINRDSAGIPQCAIYFRVMTKKFPCEVFGPRMMRIRWVSRISSILRVFKSVFYLEKSPLCNFILKPTIKDYKISMSSKIKVNPKLPLNSEQMLSVYEACIICSREEPGIYLLQGPPGTGKTTVIKTIIEQLLYTVKNVQNGGEKIKILVCAPSNGAIDELTLRLLELRSQFPSSERFKMIRLGPPNTVVHPLVKTILLSELIRKHLQQEQYSMLQNDTGLNQQFEYLVSRINMIEQKIVSLKKRNENYSLDEAELRRLNADMDKLKSVTNNWERNHDLEELFIKGADVICTTLTSCIGHTMEEMYNKGSIKLTCCIIDEATQSNEQHSLIPLMLGINKLVLVGDPMQLPATIFSEEARKLGYGDSLFHRIVKNLEMHQDSPVRILKTQYRMHSEICQFPNERFYKNQLVTANSVLNRPESLLHSYRLLCLKIPFEVQESAYINKAEADLVLLIAKIILTKTKCNIGIITPYSKQKIFLMNGYKKLREHSEDREDANNPRLIINTVDAFQGQERDVIIISCVRFRSNIFLEDSQRLNVALTRARYSTIICGNAFLFESDNIWRELEGNAKNRRRLFYANQIQALDYNYLENIILK